MGVGDMKCVRFNNAKDNVPRPIVSTWENLLVDVVSADNDGKIAPRATTEKESLPAWSPVEYRPGATRHKTNALRAWAFVIDFDGGPPERIKALCNQYGVTNAKLLPRVEKEKLGAEFVPVLRKKLEGIAHYVHTSWSHGTDAKPFALRFVVKLTRPVESGEWPAFWRAANAHFAGCCDSATSDISRIYFCAAMPAGAPEQAQHVIAGFPGAALDVDALLRRGAATDMDPEIMAALSMTRAENGTGRQVPLEELNEFAHNLARSKSPGKAEIGRRLKKMVQGERFAQPGASDQFGGIDNAIFRMCAFLAEGFPDADARHMASHFSRSLALHFREDGEGHDVDAVVAKFESKRADHLQRKAAEDRQAADARAVRIREAFGTERVDGYRDQELEQFGDMKHRWIVQFGSSYYVFFDGDYRAPVSEKSLVAACARDLSPAYTAGVELLTKTDNGKTIPKTPAQLVLEYGSVAHDVCVDLAGERAHYDPVTRVFHEAPCPLRIREGARVPEVEGWLKAIGSPELEAWIALVTKVARPCSALYLDGVKASGKSLLAEGLSRLWSKGGPTQAIHALGGSWNEDMTRCPLVFADEALPPKMRASGYTGELREAIQNARRPLVRKYKPNATMLGAMRMILAANNPNLLETTESLTPNDIGAISDRFLYVHMPQAAADYLEAIGGRKRVHEIFVEQDGLARHAIWLRDTLVVPDAGRFFFANGSAEIARSLTTSSGIRGSICSWLCMFLLDPAPLAMQQQGGIPLQVFVDDGALFVAPSALANYWQSYKTNRHPPSPGDAGRALRGLAHEGSITRSTNGREITFYKIDTENLITWSEETGYCTRDQIKRALLDVTTSKPTPLTMPGANA